MYILPSVEPLLSATIWLSSFEEMSEGKMVLLPPLEMWWELGEVNVFGVWLLPVLSEHH